MHTYPLLPRRIHVYTCTAYLRSISVCPCHALHFLPTPHKSKPKPIPTPSTAPYPHIPSYPTSPGPLTWIAFRLRVRIALIRRHWDPSLSSHSPVLHGVALSACLLLPVLLGRSCRVYSPFPVLPCFWGSFIDVYYHATMLAGRTRAAYGFWSTCAYSRTPHTHIALVT